MTKRNFYGAELCEFGCYLLVGLYVLDFITMELDKQNIALNRDDGLSCFKNISGPDSEKIKKKLFKIFKSNGLSITVEYNLIVTDFLDVKFDLKSAILYLYKNLNRELLYINKYSSYHPSVTN